MASEFLDQNITELNLHATVTLQPDETFAWALADRFVLRVMSMEDFKIVQIELQGFDPVVFYCEQRTFAGDLGLVPFADGFVGPAERCDLDVKAAAQFFRRALRVVWTRVVQHLYFHPFVGRLTVFGITDGHATVATGGKFPFPAQKEVPRFLFRC